MPYNQHTISLLLIGVRIQKSKNNNAKRTEFIENTFWIVFYYILMRFVVFSPSNDNAINIIHYISAAVKRVFTDKYGATLYNSERFGGRYANKILWWPSAMFFSFTWLCFRRQFLMSQMIVIITDPVTDARIIYIWTSFEFKKKKKRRIITMDDNDNKCWSIMNGAFYRDIYILYTLTC